ncbi:hypothetical protein ACOZ4Y_08300 [Komagataeibacter rhaeticus]
MIIANTLPPARAWNTWSDRPAAMTFLPLGVHVTPLLYSTRHKEATLLPPGEGMRFGHHGMDGRLVEFETRHGGTHIAFRYEKHDPFVLQGEWRATSLAEWGLRYWLTLCLSAETGVTVSHHDGACIVRIGYRYVALVSQMAAVQVTAHDSLEAVLDDLCGRPVRCNGSHLLSLCVSLNLVFSVECIAARRMRGSGQVRPYVRPVCATFFAGHYGCALACQAPILKTCSMAHVIQRYRLNCS